MKFTTTLKSVTTNKTETTVKLAMSNSLARQFASLHLSSVDKELVVWFEDPQGEMTFASDQSGRPGLTYQADGNGVVDSVRREEPEEGENDGEQEEMALDDGTELGGEIPTEPDDFEDLTFGSDGDSDEDGDGSNDEEEDSPEEGGAEEDEEQDDAESATDPVTKEELEQFILDEKPAFPEITVDFPALIEEKQREDLTWVELGKRYGMGSSRLQLLYGKYKSKAAEMLIQKRRGA